MEQKVELKEKEYTYKELAEFFGVSAGYLQSAKGKRNYMSQLGDYADFYRNEKNRIVITKVKKKYFKPLSTEERKKKNAVDGYNKEVINNNFDKVWAEDGINNIFNMTFRLRELLKRSEVKAENNFILRESFEDTYKMLRKRKCELYGIPDLVNGELARSPHYVFCKEDKEGNLYPLSAQENKRKEEYYHRYYQNIAEKLIFLMVGYDEYKEVYGNGYKDAVNEGKTFDDVFVEKMRELLYLRKVDVDELCEYIIADEDRDEYRVVICQYVS